MRRRAAAALVVGLAVLAACTSSSGRSAPPTTAAVSTTTATTTAETRDPGFRTRAKGVLTVGTNDPAAPYFISAGGALVGGFEYDLARALGALLGIGVRVVPAHLVSIVSGHDCGCDLYLGQVPATEGLARSTDLSEPYLPADQAVVVRAGGAIADPAAARALRWGTQLTNVDGVQLLQRQVRPTAPLELYGSEAELLDSLRAQKVDAVLLDVPAALVAAGADPSVAVIGRIQTGGAYTAVLPLGSPNTSALNDLLRRLRDDGTIGLLARRFFGVDPASVPALRLS